MTEECNFMLEKMINANTKRRIASLGHKLEMAYADVPLDMEDNELIEWRPISVYGIDTDEPVTAMLWEHLERLYVAINGNIYVSPDMGESIHSAPVFLGANKINDMKPGHCRAVWAVGDNNTILYKPDDTSLGHFSPFEMRTGPADGGHFTAIAINENGIPFTGNGTSIYCSPDRALTAEEWIKLRDFVPNTIEDIFFFFDKGKMFVHLSSDMLVSSDNSGNTWEENARWSDAMFSWE